MAFLLTAQSCRAKSCRVIIVSDINQNLRAGQTAVCSVELVSGILIVFVIFSLSGVLSFIFAGRGAQMRGEEPQGEGRSLPAVTHSPLSLRFSPSHSLFPYSLLSKLRISKALWYLGGQGIRKAGARGRKPKGIGGISRNAAHPPVPLGCHPRTVGRSKFSIFRKSIGCNYADKFRFIIAPV